MRTANEQQSHRRFSFWPILSCIISWTWSIIILSLDCCIASNDDSIFNAHMVLSIGRQIVTCENAGWAFVIETDISSFCLIYINERTLNRSRELNKRLRYTQSVEEIKPTSVYWTFSKEDSQKTALRYLGRYHEGFLPYVVSNCANPKGLSYGNVSDLTPEARRWGLRDTCWQFGA